MSRVHSVRVIVHFGPTDDCVHHLDRETTLFVRYLIIYNVRCVRSSGQLWLLCTCELSIFDEMWVRALYDYIFRWARARVCVCRVPFPLICVILGKTNIHLNSVTTFHVIIRITTISRLSFSLAVCRSLPILNGPDYKVWQKDDYIDSLPRTRYFNDDNIVTGTEMIWSSQGNTKRVACVVWSRCVASIQRRVPLHDSFGSRKMRCVCIHTSVKLNVTDNSHCGGCVALRYHIVYVWKYTTAHVSHTLNRIGTYEWTEIHLLHYAYIRIHIHISDEHHVSFVRKILRFPSSSVFNIFKPFRSPICFSIHVNCVWRTAETNCETSWNMKYHPIAQKRVLATVLNATHCSFIN